MKESLLVTIAYHHSPDRMKYLLEVVDNFLKNYSCPVKIIIDTNAPISSFYREDRIEVCSHNNLEHPFHLTCKHRRHILNNIDKYDVFAYFEDDMLLPYENYRNYLDNFKWLWPFYVPSFIRIEKDGNDELFVTDVTTPQHRIVNLKNMDNNKEFTTLREPYHALWILPQKELKESITPNFTRLHDSRETAASYPMYELKKIPLVEIENGQVSKKCYSYHIANNYVRSKESPFAKIKPENIFL